MVLEEQGSKVLNRFIQSVLPDTWGIMRRTLFFFNTVFGRFTHKHTLNPNSYKENKKFLTSELEF